MDMMFFAIKNAIDDALSDKEKSFDDGPTIIICKTIIGKGTRTGGNC